jgi:hypothetical protein
VQVAAATELLVGDFFTYSHNSGQPFDVGYDYTFLVSRYLHLIKPNFSVVNVDHNETASAVAS